MRATSCKMILIQSLRIKTVNMKTENCNLDHGKHGVNKRSRIEFRSKNWGWINIYTRYCLIATVAFLSQLITASSIPKLILFPSSRTVKTIDFYLFLPVMHNRFPTFHSSLNNSIVSSNISSRKRLYLLMKHNFTRIVVSQCRWYCTSWVTILITWSILLVGEYWIRVVSLSE